MTTAEPEQNSPEVNHLLEKMSEEYELAQAALIYFRPGKRTDAFVAARHEAVTLAHLRLGWLIGREQATHAVCRFFRARIEREEPGDEQERRARAMILDHTWLSLILVAYRLHHDQIVQSITYPPSDEITTRLTQVLSPVFTELCQHLGERGARQRLQAILDVQAPGQTDAQFSLGRALALTRLKTLATFRQARYPDPTAGDALLLRILKEYRGVHEVARHLPFEPETTEAERAAKQAKQAFLEARFQAATELQVQLARLVGLQPAAKMACAFLADNVNLDLTIPNLWLAPILAAYRIHHERLIHLLRATEQARAANSAEADTTPDAWTEGDELVNWLLSTLEHTFRTLAEQLGLTYTRCRIKAILANETPLASNTFLIPWALLHHTKPVNTPVTFPDQEEAPLLVMQHNKGAE